MNRSCGLLTPAPGTGTSASPDCVLASASSLKVVPVRCPDAPFLLFRACAAAAICLSRTVEPSVDRESSCASRDFAVGGIVLFFSCYRTTRMCELCDRFSSRIVSKLLLERFVVRMKGGQFQKLTRLSSPPKRDTRVRAMTATRMNPASARSQRPARPFTPLTLRPLLSKLQRKLQLAFTFAIDRLGSPRGFHTYNDISISFDTDG